MQHLSVHLRGDRAGTRSLVHFHPRSLRQNRRLGWLHQPSFKARQSDTADAGLMAPTQPTPYAPPDNCKNRKLGWLLQPRFKAWQSATAEAGLLVPTPPPPALRAARTSPGAWAGLAFLG